MKNLSRGFTLIEVLVVVLIIGILTSVALPQYQKAVVKAKVMKLLPLMRTIDSAEQVYYSTYMTYTEKLTDLDIDLPAGGSVNTEGTVIEYKDFRCFSFQNKSVYCISKDPLAPPIEKYFEAFGGNFICWYEDDKVKQEICASFPNASPIGSGNKGYWFQ